MLGVDEYIFEGSGLDLVATNYAVWRCLYSEQVGDWLSDELW